MDEKILDKILNISEQFFGTKNDPNQMPITKESLYKLKNLHPKTFIYKLKNKNPISWVVVLPTQTELMKKFLKNEINELELLDMTKPQVKYEAIYLCSAFTVPAFRRKGYILQMFKEAIDTIPHINNVDLFTWIYSHEGRKIVEKLTRILGKNIFIK